jgi:hypothetical protein
MGVPIYRAANNASNGLIGNTLTSLPVDGGALKAIGGVLGNSNAMNKLSNGFGKIGATGQAVSAISSRLPS